MTDTGWIAVALVLGIVIGALVVWLMNRKAAGPSHSVKALREESEKFRDEVNDHFVETAELINQLTDSYKKVFDHLSDGAERLVDDKVIRERMPEVSDQEIRLKRIGQTSSRPAQPKQATEKPKPTAPATPPTPSVPRTESASAADLGPGQRSEPMPGTTAPTDPMVNEQKADDRKVSDEKAAAAEQRDRDRRESTGGHSNRAESDSKSDAESVRKPETGGKPGSEAQSENPFESELKDASKPDPEKSDKRQ